MTTRETNVEEVILANEQVKALARCSATYGLTMTSDKQIPEYPGLATDNMNAHDIGIAVFASPEVAPDREADDDDVDTLAQLVIDLDARLLFGATHKAADFEDAVTESGRWDAVERQVSFGNYHVELTVGEA